jgi:hypothetical protein
MYFLFNHGPRGVFDRPRSISFGVSTTQYTFAALIEILFSVTEAFGILHNDFLLAAPGTRLWPRGPERYKKSFHVQACTHTPKASRMFA